MRARTPALRKTGQLLRQVCGRYLEQLPLSQLSGDAGTCHLCQLRATTSDLSQLFSFFREPTPYVAALVWCADSTTRNELETKIEPLNQFDGLTEREIVELAKQNPLALSHLYRQHYGAIYCYVNRRVGSAHDTNDIVAEVFLSMVRYLPRFRWTGAPFRSWLLVLATNQINRWIRKKRFSRFWRPIESTEQLTNQIADESDGRIELMRRAILALPLSIQTALTLHYFEDLSIDAIATIMNCRAGTVKSRLSRGREMLRIKLTPAQENSNVQRPLGSLLGKSEV